MEKTVQNDKEFAEHAMSIMRAYLNGSTIEFREHDFIKPINNNKWLCCYVSPEWQWKTTDYRIKTEPKLVPLTQEDIPAICWIRSIGFNRAYLVTLVSNIEIVMYGDNRPITLSYDNLTNGWEYSSDRKTWLPCHKNEDT